MCIITVREIWECIVFFFWFSGTVNWSLRSQKSNFKSPNAKIFFRPYLLCSMNSISTNWMCPKLILVNVKGNSENQVFCHPSPAPMQKRKLWANKWQGSLKHRSRFGGRQQIVVSTLCFLWHFPHVPCLDGWGRWTKWRLRQIRPCMSTSQAGILSDSGYEGHLGKITFFVCPYCL